jgi:hypothetical protein
MMTDIAAHGYSVHIQQPEYALVQQAPNVPEFKQWVLNEQRKKTQPYVINNLWDEWTTSTVSPASSSLTNEEKIKLIKSANEAIVSEVKDLDPEIRQLVNENFKDLLWK